jgi:hypothetical protein
MMRSTRRASNTWRMFSSSMTAGSSGPEHELRPRETIGSSIDRREARGRWPSAALTTSLTRHALNYSTVRGLDRTSCVDHTKEIRLATRTTAATLKMSTLLDCKRHVVDVAFNLRQSL